VNHVIVVSFGDFKDLIDALGGIDVNVPKPIRSNRFDCPYSTQARCDQWPGWRFGRATSMNGERALIYSRIRENVLDRRRRTTRGARQQAVIDSVTSKLASVGTFFRLPPRAARSSPLTTDLSTSQLVEPAGQVPRRARARCIAGSAGTSVAAAARRAKTTLRPRDVPRNPRRRSRRPVRSWCVVGHPLQ
jgi:hypothetical protein